MPELNQPTDPTWNSADALRYFVERLRENPGAILHDLMGSHNRPRRNTCVAMDGPDMPSLAPTPELWEGEMTPEEYHHLLVQIRRQRTRLEMAYQSLASSLQREEHMLLRQYEETRGIRRVEEQWRANEASRGRDGQARPQGQSNWEVGGVTPYGTVMGVDRTRDGVTYTIQGDGTCFTATPEMLARMHPGIAPPPELTGAMDAETISVFQAELREATINPTMLQSSPFGFGEQEMGRLRRDGPTGAPRETTGHQVLATNRLSAFPRAEGTDAPVEAVAEEEQMEEPDSGADVPYIERLQRWITGIR